MTSDNPKLSIGLPIYNGESLVGETLNALLSQTFEDFIIIISDNASTDSTENICRKYAQNDGRIQYYKSKENLGIARNFNRTFELSQSEYFQWTSHDDLYDPTYLEKCVEVLDNDRSIILCHTQAHIIDSSGQFLFAEDYQLRTASDKSWQRFGDLICASHHQHRALEQFGVVRSIALKATSLMRYYAHADRAMLAELTLMGKFHQIPDPLFFYRDHTTQSVKTESKQYSSQNKKIFNFSGPKPPSEVWDPQKKDMIDFPEWRAFYIFAAIVQNSSITLLEKSQCYLLIGLRFFKHKNWARLIRDLLMAAEQSLL